MGGSWTWRSVGPAPQSQSPQGLHAPRGPSRVAGAQDRGWASGQSRGRAASSLPVGGRSCNSAGSGVGGEQHKQLLPGVGS